MLNVFHLGISIYCVPVSISQIPDQFGAFLLQGICKQCVVHQNTLTTRSTANGKTRFRASELFSNSEAFQWQL